MEKNNGRKIDRTGASRTVDRKLSIPITCMGVNCNLGKNKRDNSCSLGNTILDPATASVFILSAGAVPRSVHSCLIWLYSLVF